MNKNVPLVSVIVTTYNRRKYLKETLDSILNQTFKDFELIVVDNFSSYDFLTYVKSFNDDRIRAFQNQNNGIIAINRNYGIKKARGQYIAFCDDDDLWMPDFLENSLQHFNNDKNIGIVTSKLYFINSNSDITYKKFHDSIVYNDIFEFDELFFQNVVNLSAAVVRRECLEIIGVFDESDDFIAVEDYHLWLRISTKYNIYFINKVLGYYRQHEGGISADLEKSLINLYKVLNNIMNLYPNHIIGFNRLAHKRINNVNWCIVKFYIKKLQFLESAKWLFRLIYRR